MWSCCKRVIFRRKLKGKKLTVMVEMPGSIPHNKKIFYTCDILMNILNELKVDFIKTPPNNQVLYMEIPDNTKPLTINLSEDFYNTLNDFTKRGVNVGVLCEFAVRYFLLKNKDEK